MYSLKNRLDALSGDLNLGIIDKYLFVVEATATGRISDGKSQLY